MNKEELVDLLIENFTDEYGNLNLKGLDFSKVKGTVNISGMKVNGDLYQNNHEVKGDLHQNYQAVKGILRQDSQEVNGSIWQNHQKSGEYILQQCQRAKEKIVNDVSLKDEDFNKDKKIKLTKDETVELLIRLFGKYDSSLEAMYVDLSNLDFRKKNAVLDLSNLKSDNDIYYDVDDSDIWNALPKMSMNDLAKYLFKNYNAGSEVGSNNIRLTGLDFSEFECDVNISGMQVKGDLYQNKQRVYGILHQDDQIAKTIFQRNQKVSEDIAQNNQRAGGIVFQNHQDASKIIQDEIIEKIDE